MLNVIIVIIPLGFVTLSMYRLLQHKALETEKSVSDLVNEAIRQLLAEDADDLAAFDEHVAEPLVTYETLLRELKADGRL